MSGTATNTRGGKHTPRTPDELKAAQNPPAFPQHVAPAFEQEPERAGMSLHDYFAAQALANPAICTGTAPEYDLRRWFGGRCGIRAPEIVAMQARDYADAMLAARNQ